MKPYQIQIPTRIFFGRNIWTDALKEAESLLSGNVMIVTTGRSLTRLGYVDELINQMKKCSLVQNIILFDRVSANPRLSEALEGIRIAEDRKADIVIGFGGGSAIDMAKAVAAGAGTKEDIREYFYNGTEPGDGTLPVIAIPTTAGTGSELSKAAIITDETKKIKSGIRGNALYPKAAVVDSVFTESVPFSITMETGFDVLAHAMESYISKAASPYTRMQSECAINIAGEMLRKLASGLNDKEAREKMSYASMIMGINLGNAGTCLPHRLQYPIGALSETGHGAGLAALYTSWIGVEYQYSREKVEKMISLLAGKSIHGKKECVATMRQFIESLGLPASPVKLGIDKGSIPAMAEKVMGNIFNDPASQEQNIIVKIYENAWLEE